MLKKWFPGVQMTDTTPPPPTFSDRFPPISRLSNYHSAFQAKGGSIYQLKDGEDPEAPTPFSESSHLLLLSCLFGAAFVFVLLLSGGTHTLLWRQPPLLKVCSGFWYFTSLFTLGGAEWCTPVWRWGLFSHYLLQGEIHLNLRWRQRMRAVFFPMCLCVNFVEIGQCNMETWRWVLRRLSPELSTNKKKSELKWCLEEDALLQYKHPPKNIF